MTMDRDCQSDTPVSGLSDYVVSLQQGWRGLRAEPLNHALWYQLAVLYATKSWVWHASYTYGQAQRCAHVLGITLPALAVMEADTIWGQAEQLMIPTPLAGVKEIVDVLKSQVQAEPADWLSWLYLVRCLEMLEVSSPDGVAKSQMRHAVVQALDCEPIAGETGHLLAQWRLRAGQPAQAMTALQAVLMQAPHRHGSWLLRAQALMQLGYQSEALAAFERAGESNNPAFLTLLAEKLFIFNFGEQSLAVRKRVAQLQPNSSNAWLALAGIQSTLSQVSEARKSVEKALIAEPDNAIALGLREDLTASGNSRAQFDLELARFEREGLRPNGRGSARLLMQSLYQDNISAERVADLHRQMGLHLEEQARAMITGDLQPPRPLPWDSTRARRLRVGYVSGDLHRQHPVNIFMLPILSRHDHERFEVFIYQTGTLIDEYTRQARRCADQWREVAHLDDHTLRMIIIDDRIDVLIDLAGHTATHRLGVFATRVAPVQVSYLGYPHSTGLPCIDWLIGDEVVAPPEHGHLFTEQVARVSGSVFCWAPNDDYPLPPDEPMQRHCSVVFASFNNLLKVSDSTIRVWTRILRESPGSKLMLKSAVLVDDDIKALTRQRFADAGGNVECLILRGPTELSQMMNEYLEVDIALDPFPYNGGTTSLQALWMGCPLVVMQGHNFVSRMGASFLTYLDRQEWLAQSEDDYVRIALALAGQVSKQPWSRQAQRQAMQASYLCQIEQHTHDIEAIYLRAFEAWLACRK